MTQRDMYDALLYAHRYKTDGCYPSTRYNDSYNKDWWKPIEEPNRKDNNMNLNDTKIIVDGLVYKAHDISVTTNYGESPKLEASAYLNPFNRTTATINCGCHRTAPTNPTIENIIFNPPATIVFWSDKTKTIVKADYEYEDYDPEKGIAMAIAKKMMADNKGRYYELFKHWRKKWDEQNKAVPDIKIDIPKNPIETFADGLKKALSKATPVSEPDWLDDIEP